MVRSDSSDARVRSRYPLNQNELMEERPVDGVTFAVTHQALVFLENTNPTTIVVCGHNWACITFCFALLLAPFVAFLDSTV